MKVHFSPFSSKFSVSCDGVREDAMQPNTFKELTWGFLWFQASYGVLLNTAFVGERFRMYTCFCPKLIWKSFAFHHTPSHFSNGFLWNSSDSKLSFDAFLFAITYEWLVNILFSTIYSQSLFFFFDFLLTETIKRFRFFAQECKSTSSLYNHQQTIEKIFCWVREFL